MDADFTTKIATTKQESPGSAEQGILRSESTRMWLK